MVINLEETKEARNLGANSCKILCGLQEEARKEKLKLKAARLLMAGQVLSEEDEEQFEGLSPKV